MTKYLLTLWTHARPIYPQLTEFEARSSAEAARIRDKTLNDLRQSLRAYATRCKEPTRRAEILNQMAFLHANVERLR